MAKIEYVPALEKTYAFESNRFRKMNQRQSYRNMYSGKGAAWMKHGVVPPQKGGHGRRIGGS